MCRRRVAQVLVTAACAPVVPETSRSQVRGGPPCAHRPWPRLWSCCFLSRISRPFNAARPAGSCMGLTGPRPFPVDPSAGHLQSDSDAPQAGSSLPAIFRSPARQQRVHVLQARIQIESRQVRFQTAGAHQVIPGRQRRRMCKPCPPLGRSFRPSGSIASLAIPMQWPTWRRVTMARGEGISSGTLPLPMAVRFECPHPSSSGSPAGVRRGDDVRGLGHARFRPAG